MIKYVIGCPAWDRAWSLPLWFESVRANVDPDETGLAFVIPASDPFTREIVNELAKDFAWLHVERDRNEQFDRDHRAEDDNHTTLATARNQLLREVNKTKPQHYLSWDSDLLLPPKTVEKIERKSVPICTVWTWLNRQQPQTLRHVNPQTGESRMIQWQEPMAATAMSWDRPGRPAHYPSHEWNLRARGFWRADVVLAFQMMESSVYSTTMYRPHKFGEDIPFNCDLERRGIPRYCFADRHGVHLYRRHQQELELGWPDICDLAREIPLAAQHLKPRDPLDEALGYYPIGDLNGKGKNASIARSDGSPVNTRSRSKRARVG